MEPCPRCDAPGDRVERREGQRSARCGGCGLVFDPGRAVTRRRTLEDAPATTHALVLPEGFEELEREHGLRTVYRDVSAGRPELTIIRRWARTSASSSTIWMLPPSLVVVGLLASLVPGRGGTTFPELGVVSFILAALAAFALVVQAKNSTYVTVASGRLTVAHGPFPWFGARDLEAASVSQLYCECVEPSGSSNQESYRVRALLHGRDDALILVEDLSTATQALFLEEAVERALGIQDRPVAAELPFKRTRR